VVKNCYFSAVDFRNAQSLGYSIRNTTGSLLLENNTFESLYRAVRIGTSGGANFAGLEDVKNVQIKGNTFQVGAWSLTSSYYVHDS